MVRRYAEGTTVSIESTRNEIERVLDQYGAASSRVTKSPDQVVIEFIAHHRAIRFRLTIPKQTDPQFTKTPKQVVSRWTLTDPEGAILVQTAPNVRTQTVYK